MNSARDRIATPPGNLMLFLARAAFWLVLVGWLMSRWSPADLEAGMDRVPDVLETQGVPRHCLDHTGDCIQAAGMIARLTHGLTRPDKDHTDPAGAVLVPMPRARPIDLR
jgi:hypothetical protein